MLLQTTKDIPDDCAKRLDLTLIPFNPSGTETGEYPDVRSDDFDTIIKHAKELKSDKKTDLIIVKGPQGGGKTATTSGIIKDFENDANTIVFPTILANLDPYDLVEQIIRFAISKKFLEKDFMSTSDYIAKKLTPTGLKEILVEIFEKSLKSKSLGIWIIDEFDTISSSDVTTDSY